MHFIQEIRSRKTSILIIMLIMAFVLSTTVVSSAMTANQLTVDYWNINFKGKPIATVSSEAEAEAFIRKVENRYVKGNENIHVVSVEPELKVEKVTLKVKDTDPEEVLTGDLDSVIEDLFKPIESEKTYVAKEGDTLWGIASQEGMSIDELLKSNPQIDADLLMPDDVFTFKSVKYALNVTTEEEDVSVQPVYYETVYEDTDELEQGDEKVKTEGQNGQARVSENVIKVNGKEVKREVIDYKQVTAPVNEVILRGTKEAEPEPQPEQASRAQAPAQQYAPAQSVPQSSYVGQSGLRSTILNAAYSQLGQTQDCTSLVSRSLAAAGIYWHSWPQQYANLGQWTSNPQPGDLCIYRTHVAVYAGGGRAVHGGWNDIHTTAVGPVQCTAAFIGYVSIQ